MVSKGIDIYGYVGGDAFTFHATTPKSAEVIFTRNNKMQTAHLEIALSDIGILEHSGKFNTRVTYNNTEALNPPRYAEIAPTTGNLNGGNLGDMLQTQSQISPGQYAISYGFYDAGTGEADEFYAYVTGDQSDWMGNVVKANNLSSLPFGQFVLPGSHDAGMFTGIDSNAQARSLVHSLLAKCANDPKAAATAILVGMAFPITGLIGAALLPLIAALLVTLETTSAARRILINWSYTQKDPISKQLAVGARYFDFRPGYSPFDDTDRKAKVLRHWHNFIPGCKFDDFLTDVVNFLKLHTGEIVVVCTNYAGFLDKDAMRPSQSEIDNAITNALGTTGIKKGSIEDLKKTYGELVESKTRLIVLTNEDLDANCRDSYSDSGYATNDPKSVIDCLGSALNKTLKTWTVLQLQATYTNTTSGLAEGALTLSDASSPLLSTKAPFDRATYDWVTSPEASVANRCSNGLLTLLNDFVDNALTDRCIDLTVQRSRMRYSQEFGAAKGNPNPGDKFADQPPPASELAQVIVWYGEFVNAIQCVWRTTSTGSLSTGPLHGSASGTNVLINLDPGEYITRVDGQSGWKIDQLTFTTSQNKVYGPYGGKGGNPFSITDIKAVGTFGRSSSTLDSVGFLTRVEPKWFIIQILNATNSALSPVDLPGNYLGWGRSIDVRGCWKVESGQATRIPTIPSIPARSYVELRIEFGSNPDACGQFGLAVTSTASVVITVSANSYYAFGLTTTPPDNYVFAFLGVDWAAALQCQWNYWRTAEEVLLTGSTPSVATVPIMSCVVLDMNLTASPRLSVTQVESGKYNESLYQQTNSITGFPRR